MTLCLGAELTYVENAYGYGSNKFYKVVLAGTGVFTCYGRRNGGLGTFARKGFADVPAAATEMWRLLRSKTGKGYHVIDAAVFDVPDEVIAAANAPTRGIGWPDRTVIGTWDAQQRGDRFHARQAVLHRPDRTGRSPRTPTQGRALLVALLDPACPEQVLVDCALADPTERFLVPMGLSHPACTDEVRVAHYLAGNGVDLANAAS